MNVEHYCSFPWDHNVGVIGPCSCGLSIGEYFARHNAVQASTYTASLPVEPSPPPTCAWAKKREPRADIMYPECLVKHSAEFQAAVAYANARRASYEAYVVASLKRTLREWPTCQYGGELSVAWEAGGDNGALAYWRCSHCEAERV